MTKDCLFYCNICTNKRYNGYEIICNLNSEKPDFQHYCQKFNENPKEVNELKKAFLQRIELRRKISFENFGHMGTDYKETKYLFGMKFKNSKDLPKEINFKPNLKRLIVAISFFIISGIVIFWIISPMVFPKIIFSLVSLLLIGITFSEASINDKLALNERGIIYNETNIYPWHSILASYIVYEDKMTGIFRKRRYISLGLSSGSLVEDLEITNINFNESNFESIFSNRPEIIGHYIELYKQKYASIEAEQ
jgi:hypothetical protein